jgi:hypothetical protein
MQIAKTTAGFPPWVRWAGPFLVFMAVLALAPALGLPPLADLSIRLALPALAYLAVSRGVIEWKFTSPVWSVVLGIAVFGLWIAPDLLVPGWRQHWLFQNAITGKLESTLAQSALTDPLALFLRITRAVVVVPLVEELFCRGWLMRWLIDHDFESVPLGAYRRQSFWLTTFLFAGVHGPYWDVGLLTGAVYNGWMVRTRSLADMILVHAVTNACLAGFVLATKRWEYWL